MNNEDSGFLKFESPIADLQAKIAELKNLDKDGDQKSQKIDIKEEVNKLEEKCKQLTQKIYARVNDWQISQIARHPRRPYTKDYIDLIFNEFTEIHGDRWYADDRAIIGGLAVLDHQSVIFIGHQKGRETKEKIDHSFGMPRPEGYRKALRLMKIAEKFNLPIVTFIDTPGAYPGIGAEQRNQSEAIALNLMEMSALKCPIISIVIGEGGSGGALALSVSDVILMLEYSIYSVISPEGCSQILWKSSKYTEVAAKNLALTAPRLQKLGIIDEIIKEPLGSAYADPVQMAKNIKVKILDHLTKLKSYDTETLIKKRQDKYLNVGFYREV